MYITQTGEKMLAIRLTPEIENRLAELAKRTGRTKTFYAREAILRYLDDLEDQYLALDRLEHPAKRWTLDELEQDRDLDS
jgi:RHH-type rel operon transcriptional repressor/antitoxin RelB